MRYRAFFSYSRNDEPAAKWLHARLDGYRVPRPLVGQTGAHGLIPIKLHPIFQDRTDMPTGGVLGDRITTALAESESLIVLCSPSAASSRWVAQECDTFIKSGRANRIYPVIAPNLPQSENLEDDFFPSSLRGHGLLAADLRYIKLPNAKIIGDGRKVGVLKLIAGLIGVGLDDLVAREAKRAKQRLLVVAGFASLTVIALAVVGAVFVSQTWRPALNAKESLELRQGPKLFSIYNTMGFGPRVELPIGTDAIDELNGKLAQIRDEVGMGYWQSRRDGIRAWGFEVADLMRPEARLAWLARLGMLSQGDLTTRGLAGLPVPFGPAASIRESERVVLAQTPSISSVLWQYEWRLPPITHCGVSQSDDFSDYVEYLLEESDDVTEQRLRGIIAAAKLSNAINGEVLIRLLTLYGRVNEAWRDEYSKILGDATEPITAARISARFRERPTFGEVRALADLARTLLTRSVYQDVPPITASQRKWLRDSLGRCGQWTSSILASVADAEDIVHLRRWSRTQTKAAQGRIALKQLAVSAKLQPQDIHFVLDVYGFDRDIQSTYETLVNTGEWLRSIAELQGLPPDVTEDLLEYASQQVDAKRLDRADRALAILASEKGGLPDAQKSKFSMLLNRRFAASDLPIPTVSEFKIAGQAEINGTKVSMLRELWEEVQSDAALSIAPKDRLGSGTPIEEMIALARLAVGAIVAGDQTVTRPIPGWFETGFAEALNSGFAPKGLCLLAEAEAQVRPMLSADAFRAALMRNRSNANARLATVYVQAARIMSAADTEAEIQAARNLYATEFEPEIKHDFGELLLQTSPIGGQCR